MAPHIPVLLDKVLETLGDISGKTIVDATFGAGGYSRAFLNRGAKVIAFDRDPNVVPLNDKNFEFINRPFSEMKNHVPAADAIVFDFGVSSMQIDTPERGFSWRFDAPLDMRMGPGVSAAELIENSDAGELARILRDYGDMKKAGVIARELKKKTPRTTFELRDLIFDSRDVAPVFQALRIAVNDELGEIRRALSAVPDLLAPGGICACVTFHSIEDGLVKNVFLRWTTRPGDPRIPGNSAAPFTALKTFRPDEAEIASNPRSRSSHLRAVRKIYNIG